MERLQARFFQPKTLWISLRKALTLDCHSLSIILGLCFCSERNALLLLLLIVVVLQVVVVVVVLLLLLLIIIIIEYVAYAGIFYVKKR